MKNSRRLQQYIEVHGHIVAYKMYNSECDLFKPLHPLMHKPKYDGSLPMGGNIVKNIKITQSRMHRHSVAGKTRRTKGLTLLK